MSELKIEKKNNSIDSIFLIGMMGSGKTTIGKILSNKLKKSFIDLDHELEIHFGMSITKVFENEGETIFREAESLIVERYTKKFNVVLSTGGGVILRECNRVNLRNRGLVVYLASDFKMLYKRICKNNDRPLLNQTNRKKTFQDLMISRDNLYRKTAHLIFENDFNSADSAACSLKILIDEYLRKINENCKSQNYK